MLVAAVLFEVLAYRDPNRFWIGSRIWAVMACVTFMSTFGLIVAAVVADARERNWVGLGLLALVAILVFSGISSTAVVVNHEATQQIGSALRSLREPGWNYAGAAFLGYPSRQYLLAAAPAAFLGRDLLSLRLGYGLICFVGVMGCYAGLRFYLKPRGANAAQLAAVTIGALFSFPHVVVWLRQYEQAMIPISLTLLLTGWLLLALSRPTILNLFNVAWIGGMTGTSYTPALFAWTVLLAVTLLLLVDAVKGRAREPFVAWLMIGAYVGTIGILSFRVREDLPASHLWSKTAAPLSAILANKWDRLSNQFWPFFAGRPSPMPPFINSALLLPLGAYVVEAIRGRLGRFHLVIAASAVTAVLLALTGPGHGDLPAAASDRDLHRAIVVLPALLVGTVLAGVEKLGAGRLSLRRSWVTAAFALVCWLALTNLRLADGLRPASAREAFFADLAQQIRVLGAPPEAQVHVRISSGLRDLGNARDYLEYLLPRYSLVQNTGGVRSRGSEVQFAEPVGPFDWALVYIEEGTAPNSSPGNPSSWNWESVNLPIDGGRAVGFRRAVQRPRQELRHLFCVGECDVLGTIGLSEFGTCLAAALSASASPGSLPRCDLNADSRVDVSEVVRVVRTAPLEGKSR